MPAATALSFQVTTAKSVTNAVSYLVGTVISSIPNPTSGPALFRGRRESLPGGRPVERRWAGIGEPSGHQCPSAWRMSAILWGTVWERRFAGCCRFVPREPKMDLSRNSGGMVASTCDSQFPSPGYIDSLLLSGSCLQYSGGIFPVSTAVSCGDGSADGVSRFKRSSLTRPVPGLRVPLRGRRGRYRGGS
jgi:hypothetical protein